VVVEGTDAPAGLPPGSLFFDTDCEPPVIDWQAQIDALAARLDALEARGVIAYAQIVTTVATGDTLSDPVAGLSVTFDADPARRYRVTIDVNVASTVGTDQVGVLMLRNGAQVQARYTGGQAAGVSRQCGMVVTRDFTGLTGAQTFSVATSRNTGTGTVTCYGASTAPAFIMVEVVG
jgi:hypothetical protein